MKMKNALKKVFKKVSLHIWVILVLEITIIIILARFARYNIRLLNINQPSDVSIINLFFSANVKLFEIILKKPIL